MQNRILAMECLIFLFEALLQVSGPSLWPRRGLQMVLRGSSRCLSLICVMSEWVRKGKKRSLSLNAAMYKGGELWTVVTQCKKRERLLHRALLGLKKAEGKNCKEWVRVSGRSVLPMVLRGKREQQMFVTQWCHEWVSEWRRGRIEGCHWMLQWKQGRGSTDGCQLTFKSMMYGKSGSFMASEVEGEEWKFELEIDISWSFHSYIFTWPEYQICLESSAGPLLPFFPAWVQICAVV